MPLNTLRPRFQYANSLQHHNHRVRTHDGEVRGDSLCYKA